MEGLVIELLILYLKSFLLASPLFLLILPIATYLPNQTKAKWKEGEE